MNETTFWSWTIAAAAVTMLFAQLFGHTGAVAIFVALAVSALALTRYVLTTARFGGKAVHICAPEIAANSLRDIAVGMYHRQSPTMEVRFDERGMRFKVLVIVLEAEPVGCWPEGGS